MRIVEQYIESKIGTPGVCEDGIVATGDFIAVIDGATNKSEFSFHSKSPGRIAMELIREAVSVFPRDISAADGIDRINRHISAWYEAQGILEAMTENSEARCTASIVIYSREKKELWFVGDCQALLNGREIQPQKQVDRIFSDLRALVIHAELVQGKTEKDLLERDTSRERILDLLRLQTKLQNIPGENEFVYYVIDGFQWKTEAGLRIIPVDRPGGEIVLASDGYPRLFSTLKETECYLARVLRDDPLCYKIYRSTKGRYGNNLSFDDRSYIRFTY
jgi:glycerophosphoryl diester phosphodiesterase